MPKLSEKDKRALKIGAVSAAGIILFLFGWNFMGRWSAVRNSVAGKWQQIKLINLSPTQLAALNKAVPMFEMPQKEQKQKFLFRENINEQLKKSGIKAEGLQFLPVKRSRGSVGYRLLRLKCRAGKCNFGQVLDLLCSLRKNPYLVAIEEFRLQCDPKKRQEFKLDITVSTFVR